MEAIEAKRKVDDLAEQLSIAEKIVADERAARPPEPAQEEEPEQLPPLFSKMEAKNGYNCRMLSAGRINCILMTDFLAPKNTQQSNMIGLSCEIVELDFECKLPTKVNVHEGVGKCFKPYQCMCTLQNEDNQTVFFKVSQGSESIAEVAEDIKQLDIRNKRPLEAKNGKYPDRPPKKLRAMCVDKGHLKKHLGRMSWCALILFTG